MKTLYLTEITFILPMEQQLLFHWPFFNPSWRMSHLHETTDVLIWILLKKKQKVQHTTVVCLSFSLALFLSLFGLYMLKSVDRRHITTSVQRTITVVSFQHCLALTGSCWTNAVNGLFGFFLFNLLFKCVTFLAICASIITRFCFGLGVKHAWRLL